MAQNNFEILTNGGTIETRAAALIAEVEETGGMPRAWAEHCPEAVLGLFRTVGQETLPVEVFATAMLNLTI
ncbi:MAG: hypothetical protein AAB860_00160 [Patescibacteria group bacterium]